jgi:hypothetical protein
MNAAEAGENRPPLFCSPDPMFRLKFDELEARSFFPRRIEHDFKGLCLLKSTLHRKKKGGARLRLLLYCHLAQIHLKKA